MVPIFRTHLWRSLNRLILVRRIDLRKRAISHSVAFCSRIEISTRLTIRHPLAQIKGHSEAQQLIRIPRKRHRSGEMLFLKGRYPSDYVFEHTLRSPNLTTSHLSVHEPPRG